MEENMQETNSGATESGGYSSRIELEPFGKAVDEIRSEFAKVIVGQLDAINLMVAAVICDGHVLIEGVPGIAKTLSAKIMARLMSVDFNRIQFTPDLMPSDVVGTSIFNPKTAEFELRRGPVFSNIILADEINRAPAKTQAALFEVMEERQVTIDGATHRMSEPYMVIATQNPIEQEGTYRLPEAQIDRFIFKIEMGYPTIDEENDILKMKHEDRGHLDLSKLRPVLTPADIEKLKKLAHAVHVDKGLIGYITAIVNETRNHHALFLGASPRASIYILAASKALAAMSGRDFITPEDVQYMALPVMRHRIILSPEQEMEGIKPDTVIREILKKIEVPR